MATSPIYSWPEPDNTDLVKNGALAIRTLGNAIDTTMGTMVAKTIIDAKGDLIAGTAADTAARLAVGNNGETLVADSSTATGLRYQSAYNGNAVINGGMDIWQRGTSFTSASVYTADRWFKGSQPNWTTSRQTSGLTGFQYAMRFQRDSGNTSTTGCQMFYNLETADALRFAGQTVTVSFYARAGANFSATSSQFSYIVYTGTGTDQRRDQSTAYTGEAQAANSSVTLTTSWQRFQFTASIASTATEIAIALGYTPTATAGAADYADITGIQLEVGSVATTFKRSNGSGGTIQGETSACQRYYYRSGSQEILSFHAMGIASSTTDVWFLMKLPTTMRVRPTSLDYANLIVTLPGQADYAFTNLALQTTRSDADVVAVLSTGSTGLTASRPYVLYNNSTANGYIGLNAEL